MRSQTGTAGRRAVVSLRVAAAVLALVTGTSSSSVLGAGAGEGHRDPLGPYGIPHIFAPDHPSLFYAYGYAQMEAHSELLLRLYAQARGRGAEFYGEQYLDGRSLGAHQRHPRDGEGVGRGAERRSSRRSSPSFVARPERAGPPSTRPTSAPAAKGVLPLTRRGRLRALPARHPLRLDHQPVEARRRGCARAEAETHGSNEWAIAPSYSASGNAMLMSNSHLQWGDMHTYFEVQLTAPGVTSYGAVWVGFPVLRQCFTEYLGWTQTTNNPAESDLYRLTLKDGGYVLDGQVKPVRDAQRDHQGAAGATARCATSR